MFNQNKLNNKQKGFSLVELLVGMVISLFVIGGALSYLVTSGKSLKVQNSSDLIQENARFAFEALASNARLAGLNRATDSAAFNQFDTFAIPSPVQGINYRAICADQAASTPAVGDASACTVNGLNYKYKDTATNVITEYDSDRISFDYVTDQGLTCSGTEIDGMVSVIETYWVSDLDGDGVPSLYCYSQTSPLSFSTPRAYNNYVPAAPVAIVDGISSLQVQYGLDSDATQVDLETGLIVSDGGTNTYVSYDQITPANRRFIQSIKVALLVSGGQSIQTQASTEERKARVYRVLDALIQFPDSDGRTRQALSTTIFFPNLPLTVL